MHSVGLVKVAQRPRAGQVLGLAFEDDPMWAAVMPEEGTRLEKLAKLFTDLTRLVTAANGQPVNTALDAVALWLPPGRKLGLRALVRSRFATASCMMALPSEDRDRMMTVLRQLDSRRKELVADPHWYLLALGTHPDHRGRGLGTQLVRFGTDWADRTGHLTYLETETEGNVRYYEQLGFEVAEASTAEGLDVPIWLMIRPPDRPLLR